MFSLLNCLKKESGYFNIVARQGEYEDKMPAGLYYGHQRLMSIPKGMIREQTNFASDNSIAHRGWRDIVRELVKMKLVNKDKLIGRIEWASGGGIV